MIASTYVTRYLAALLLRTVKTQGSPNIRLALGSQAISNTLCIQNFVSINFLFTLTNFKSFFCIETVLPAQKRKECEWRKQAHIG